MDNLTPEQQRELEEFAAKLQRGKTTTPDNEDHLEVDLIAELQKAPPAPPEPRRDHGGEGWHDYWVVATAPDGEELPFDSDVSMNIMWGYLIIKRGEDIVGAFAPGGWKYYVKELCPGHDDESEDE